MSHTILIDIETTIQAIRECGYESMTPAELVSYWSESIDAAPSPATLWTIAGLNERFGYARVSGWINALKAANADSLIMQLTGIGVPLDHPMTVQALQDLATAEVFTAQDVADIRSLTAVPQVTRWEQRFPGVTLPSEPEFAVSLQLLRVRSLAADAAGVFGPGATIRSDSDFAAAETAFVTCIGALTLAQQGGA